MAPRKKKPAADKSPKRPRSGGPPAREASPLEFLQHLFADLPDAARLALLSEISGLDVDESFLVKPPVPKTAAARKTQRLVDEARLATTAIESIALLEQAVEVARKAVGGNFEKFTGRLGESDAGLDYLEVKTGLAAALGAAGQPDAARAHLLEVLRLDPADPTGIRALLLADYFEAGHNDDADRFLRDHCPEHWPEWLYGRLLVDLRRGLRGTELDAQLKRAHGQNAGVLSLLLGERLPDFEPPLSVDADDEGAAQMYAEHFLRLWRETPGAVSWLRDAASRLKLDVDPSGSVEALLPPTGDDIARMPWHPEPVWIVGIQETPPMRMPGEKRERKHWLVFALTPAGDLIDIDIPDKRPSAGQLWKVLVAVMQNERSGGKPRTLQIHPPALERRLRHEASGTGIEIEIYDHPELLTASFGPLLERLRGGQSGAALLAADAIRQTPLDPDEVWEAAVTQLSQRIEIGTKSVRPTAALVMNRGDGTILWHEVFVESPPPAALDTAVRMAITRPAAGSPRRPRQVFVRDHDEALSLQALSDEAGFVCEVGGNLELIDLAIADLGSNVFGGEPPHVLAHTEGITAADFERFYTVAAEFFRAHPWKQFEMDEIVALERLQPAGSTLYGLVMGQSGITVGLAAYHRLADIRRMFDEQSDDKRDAPAGFSVIFGEEGDVPPADLDAIEQFGWPIATPEAYPAPMRVLPGPAVETPSADEFRFLTSALEGIARLSRSRDRASVVESPSVQVRVERLGLIDDLGALS